MHVPLEHCWAVGLPLPSSNPVLSIPILHPPSPLQPSPARECNHITSTCLCPGFQPIWHWHTPTPTSCHPYPGLGGTHQVSSKNNYLKSAMTRRPFLINWLLIVKQRWSFQTLKVIHFQQLSAWFLPYLGSSQKGQHSYSSWGQWDQVRSTWLCQTGGRAPNSIERMSEMPSNFRLADYSPKEATATELSLLMQEFQ